MQERRFTQSVFGIVLCMAIGLSLLLWRCGLAPIYAWLVGVNVVALLLYGYDKRQAVVGGFRIPEVVLHCAALSGGSPGAALGQMLFRHKTRKRRFRMVFFAILALQGLAIYGYWRFLRT